jgi:hypothetical protein
MPMFEIPSRQGNQAIGQTKSFFLENDLNYDAMKGDDRKAVVHEVFCG